MTDALHAVAQKALSYVTEGMRLGLGTGRAAEAFIEQLGERVRAGLQVVGVPTSNRSDALARKLNIPLVGLSDVERLDLAFDGADEVAPDLNLTKGLGGALLRERVVASEAARFIVLCTEEKLVDRLGSRAPIPVEVVPFAVGTVVRRLARAGFKPALRQGQASPGPYMTDNQNLIVDVGIQPTADAAALEQQLLAIPGVVDTGLFVAMADEVLVGGPSGVRQLKRA